MNTHVFIIGKKESVKTSWLRDASSFALFFALIGVGVLLESAAMQWAGFFVAVLVTIKIASGVTKQTRSPEEAKAEIDRISEDTP